ncbi:tyrosine-type recombinase/integrase [Nonomuraea sp. NPDC001023]|uniref:tyrosine-type recombinase/integrase n=1 Tax=unclassified Nonomuraea TaxID=2593643 RepID=UPI003324E43F
MPHSGEVIGFVRAAANRRKAEPPHLRTSRRVAWSPSSSGPGVQDVRVHDVRHTAATLLIEQGVHIRVVQEILGHTRVTTTERYTHVATLQMKDASDRMDSALWG